MQPGALDVLAAWPSEGHKSDSLGQVVASSASPSSVRQGYARVHALWVSCADV